MRPADRPRSYAQVQLVSCDRDIIERVIDLVGHGRVLGPYKSQQRKENHSIQWRWQISGERAKDLMRQIRPYMGERRGAKIDESLAET